MSTKSFNQQLADAIKLGIAKSQTIIAKNNAKEQNGLAKLSKTLGGQDPALTGAGGNLGAGGGSMTEVPNLARAEEYPYHSAGKDGMYRRGEGLVGTVATRLRPQYKRSAAKKNNTRAEYEASKVEKGALPETDMAMSEMDGNDEASCPMCNGPLHILGSLGNTIHMVCRNCGAMHATTPHDENTEAKEDSDPSVSKAMLHPNKRGENAVREYGDRPLSQRDPDGFGWAEASKRAAKARVNNKVAESKAQEVEKSEPLATVRTNKMKGISGLPAPKSKMVVKGEMTRLPDGSGCATGTVGNLKKEETSPIKEAPMTALVMPAKVTGAKVGNEVIPKAINHDGSGEITKGKSFNKGALVEHVKNAANKAGVPVKDVLGYKPPKTLQAVKPAASPNFNKAEWDKVPVRTNEHSTTGVAREVGIKNKGQKTPGLDAAIANKPLLQHHGMLRTKLTGGVQGQIAASKKPLIPMVNQGGVVAKGEKRPGEDATKYVSRGKMFPGAIGPDYFKRDKAAKNNKVAESKAQEVEKAEPTMAKPVTKSPSSGPAGKAPAIKASPAVMKTPKL
jgi:hypothetical protein